MWHLATSSRVSCVLVSNRDKSQISRVQRSKCRHLAWEDAKRVVDDGSHLSVTDDSDLTDFICHHAWFEGDEVALPREDRVCLLGNLTGRTPKSNSTITRTWQAPFLSIQNNTSLSQKKLVLMKWNQTRWQLTTRTAATMLQLLKNHYSKPEEGGSRHPAPLWTPERGGVLAGSPSQPRPARGSRLRAAGVRVSSMRRQRTSSRSFQ